MGCRVAHVAEKPRVRATEPEAENTTTEIISTHPECSTLRAEEMWAWRCWWRREVERSEAPKPKIEQNRHPLIYEIDRLMISIAQILRPVC